MSLGCQVCDWGTSVPPVQYIKRTVRAGGCLVIVAQQQSTGNSSLGVPVQFLVISHFFFVFSFFCFPFKIKVLYWQQDVVLIKGNSYLCFEHIHNNWVGTNHLWCMKNSTCSVNIKPMLHRANTHVHIAMTTIDWAMALVWGHPCTNVCTSQC